MLQKLTLLLGFLILGSCTQLSQSSLTTSGEIPPLSPPKIELIDIGSLNNGQTDGTGSFAFYADYPVFSGTQLSDHIRVWLQSQIDLASVEAKENQEYMPDLRPEFMASFEIHTGSIMAITYSVGKYIGGAHGNEETKSFVIDGHGNRVIFPDIFVDYEKNKDTIRAIMIHDAEKIPGTWDKSDVGVGVSDGVDEFLRDPNFYFSGSDLVLMYQKYQIGPGSSGPIEVIFSDTTLIKPDITGSARYEIPLQPSGQGGSGEISDRPHLIDEVLAAEKGKYIALTFDDGPSKANTPGLLDTLRKYGAKATFYVLGKNTSYFPEIVRRAANEGHEIGSHTWSHPQLTRLSRAQMVSERDRTDAAIQAAIGTRALTMRPPYGAYNQTVREVFARPIILWDVDTLDWKHRNVSKNISIATSGAHDGAIILFHDIHATSVGSIESVIKTLQAKGYIFVTVSELLKLKNSGKAVTGGVVCTSGGKCK